MSRRKPSKGQLSFFDLPAGKPTPAAVKAVIKAIADPGVQTICLTVDAPGRSAEEVMAHYAAPGAVNTSHKGWFCVRQPDGSPRDALAVLYGIEYDQGQPVAISCPALNRRWDRCGRAYCDVVLAPFYEAVSAYAAADLGLSKEALQGLTYVTVAWHGETRPILRDESHRGNVPGDTTRETPGRGEPDSNTDTVQPAPTDVAPAPVMPSYIADGAFVWPSQAGESQSRYWFCFCDPDGALHDALAMLYVVRFCDGAPVAIACPVLGRDWLTATDYRTDCFQPFCHAAYAYAAEVLGLTADQTQPLAYLTLAHPEDQRTEQRSLVGHLGSTRPVVVRSLDTTTTAFSESL